MPGFRDLQQVRLLIQGDVQGVGFRSWIRVQALRLGLRGKAENVSDRSVEILAQGQKKSIDSLLDMLRTTKSSPGRIANVTLINRYDLNAEDPLFSSFETK